METTRDREATISGFAIPILFCVLIAAPSAWNSLVSPLPSVGPQAEEQKASPDLQLSKDDLDAIKQLCDLRPPTEPSSICKRLGEAN